MNSTGLFFTDLYFGLAFGIFLVSPVCALGVIGALWALITGRVSVKLALTMIALSILPAVLLAGVLFLGVSGLDFMVSEPWHQTLQWVAWLLIMAGGPMASLVVLAQTKRKSSGEKGAASPTGSFRKL